MKLINITHDGTGGFLDDLADLIDTVEWHPGLAGENVLTITWTDGKPELHLSCKGSVTEAVAKLKCCLWADDRRRALWGPRHVVDVIDPAHAGIVGSREFVYRPAA